MSDLADSPEQLPHAARTRRLTVGQRDVLDLGAQGFTSKEIARKLEISSHTVDQRFARARACLGASDRRDAIRLYRASAMYQPMIYEPSQLHDTTADAPLSLQFDQPEQATGNDDKAFSSIPCDGEAESFKSWLPFPTRKGQRNELTVAQRIFWLAAILIFSIIGVRAVLESLLDLGELLSTR